MGIEDLFDDIRRLPPGRLAEVGDFVKYLHARAVDEDRFDGPGGSLVDEIMADPVRKAELLASVREAMDEHEHGESLDMEALFDEILAGRPE